jgi:hypothetical protein
MLSSTQLDCEARNHRCVCSDSPFRRHPSQRTLINCLTFTPQTHQMVVYEVHQLVHSLEFSSRRGHIRAEHGIF